MNTFARLAAVAFVVVCLFQIPTAPAPNAAPAPLAFQGGASSVDDLLDDFLRALSREDPTGLAALRVTEREYRELVVPGNVPPGDDPQILSGEASEYFWQVMNQKSAHYQELLLARFGGEDFTIKDVSFEKGHKVYAGHQAWRRLSLLVTDDEGQDRLIRTGSIIERDGRFKFVSFIRD